MIKTKPPKAKKARKVKEPEMVVPSTHCPTCGKRFVAQTAAEKQKAYRERKKAPTK